MSEKSYYKQLCVQLPDGTKETVGVDQSTYIAAVVNRDKDVLQKLVKNVTSLRTPISENSASDATPEHALEIATPDETAREDEDAEPLRKKNDCIWSNDKSEEGRKRDRAATFKLLEILSSDRFQKVFNDNKTKKLTVWNQVADELRAAGFPVHVEGKNPGLKCDQKYRNLERQQKDFVLNAKTSGKGNKAKPYFFDEMQALCAGKHTVTPVVLVGTALPHRRASAVGTGSAAPSAASHSVGRTCGCNSQPTEPTHRCATYKKGNNKKMKKSSEIIEILHRMEKEADERQKKSASMFEGMMQFLEQRQKEQQEEDNKQFQQMVEMHKEKIELQKALIAALTHSRKSTKRRRPSSSSNTD